MFSDVLVIVVVFLTSLMTSGRGSSNPLSKYASRPEYRCTCMVNSQNKGYHSYFVSTLEKAGKQNSMEISETMAAPVSGKSLRPRRLLSCAYFLVHNSSSRWKLDCGSTYSQESHQIIRFENFSDTNCIILLFLFWYY